MIDATFIDLLRDLTQAHGTSGAEGDVREIFRRETTPLGGQTSTDRLGSIMWEPKPSVDAPSSPRVMLTAHMDEVGFAIQSITEKGFLQVVALGGWWTHSLLSQRLRFKNSRGEEILGIVTSTPPHFLPESERSKVLALEQLYVDIGATSRDEVISEYGLRLGDPAVPDSEFRAFGRTGRRFVAKAFDNRVGCGVVLEVLKQQGRSQAAKHQLCGVLTVQEEVGCRGAVTACHLARPDVALIMEGTPADDTPGTPPSAGGQGHLGKGVQIRLLDPTALMSRPLVDFLVSVAEKANIPHQIAVRRSGGTDAKSIHVHGLGVPAVVLGVPARYIHSHNSVIDVDDYAAAISLVTKALEAMDGMMIGSWTRF
jgi:putative aminopeptidase FrvX